MIDVQKARRIAARTLNHPDFTLGEVRELESGWCFPYVGKSGGSNGVIVHKQTGACFQLGSAFPLERDLKLYELGYRFHAYDLVVTALRDRSAAEDALLRLRMPVVEPSYDGRKVWHVAREMRREEIAEKLKRLPAIFPAVGLYFRIEVLEEARREGWFSFDAVGCRAPGEMGTRGIAGLVGDLLSSQFGGGDVDALCDLLRADRTLNRWSLELKSTPCLEDDDDGVALLDTLQVIHDDFALACTTYLTAERRRGHYDVWRRTNEAITFAARTCASRLDAVRANPKNPSAALAAYAPAPAEPLTRIAYKLVGSKEYGALSARGYRAFPVPSPDDAPFVAFFEEALVVQLADGAKQSGESFAFVARFALRADSLSRFDVRSAAGEGEHIAVSAAQLGDLNDALVGYIELIYGWPGYSNRA